MGFLGNTFTYNNQNSEQYGLRFLILNSSANNLVGGSKSYKTQYLKKGHRRTITKAEYSEESCLSFEAEILSDSVMSDTDYKEVCKWLFNESSYKKLTINSDEYYGVYFNCIFSEAEEITYGVNNKFGVVGFRFVVNCDAPWGWQSQVRKISHIGTTKIVVDSDAKDYTYPILNIYVGDVGGDIKIENIKDANRPVIFNNLPPNSVIKMSPQFGEVVWDKDENIWENFISKRFLRLFSGINDISLSGDIIQIILEYEGAKLI